MNRIGKVGLLSLLLIIVISCGDYKPNDLLPKKDVNVIIDLSLPSYQNLLTPMGYAYTPESPEYGLRGIVIINKNSTTFVAYDRACPHLAPDVCSKMTFNGINLICPCDNVKFNPWNGGASESVEFQAREYHVEAVGSNANVLRIRSF